MAIEILGALRRKYTSYLPKDRSVVDPESGEVISSLDPEGREVLDTTPIAPPVGFTPQPSMFDYVRELVRSERLRQEVEAQGFETFEEADDFDVDDDFDPSTPYENDFDPDIKELVSAGKEVVSSKAKQPSVEPDKGESGIQKAKPSGSAEPSQPEGDKK